jgi:hypothetical protein
MLMARVARSACHGRRRTQPSCWFSPDSRAYSWDSRAIAAVLWDTCVAVLLGGILRRWFYKLRSTIPPNRSVRRIIPRSILIAHAAFGLLVYLVRQPMARNPSILLLGLDGHLTGAIICS